MLAVIRIIRILVIIQIIRIIKCEDRFTEQNLLHLQQYTANHGNNNAISYSNVQNDPNADNGVNLMRTQYQLNDDTNKNNFGQRSLNPRNRKLYRIKNPFQKQLEETEKQSEDTESQDNNVGASNQYASMQYSLPPEEFLQKLRAENQYYQQTQMSSPSSNIEYTATPMPQLQYQYSTVTPSPYQSTENYNNQNQLSLQQKVTHGPNYLSSPSSYQYSTPNTFLDNSQSTVSSTASYLSTTVGNNQYSTQPSTYISSALPIYLSSPTNTQSYVSSPFSFIQASSPDYNNRVSTSVGNDDMNYNHNNPNRYSFNIQQQYQTNPTTTTTTPSSYSEQMLNSWQSMNSATNPATKSLQDNLYNRYPNYSYRTIQQQPTKLENIPNNINSNIQQPGSLTAANNLYINYVQPDSQVLNNLKLHTRDVERTTDQTELYSNGDFGWKLTNKKPLTDDYSSDNSPKYSSTNMGSSNAAAVSQMNFHFDTGKSHNYDQISKSATDTIDAQEFAKAAAKAHERYKQQQQQLHLQQQLQDQLQQLYTNSHYNEANNIGNDIKYLGVSYSSQLDKMKSNNENFNNLPYLYDGSQNNLVTPSPYFLSTTRDNLDISTKQPFDHDKALKNIVPIDVSNVVGNLDEKTISKLENNGRYISSTFGKDQLNQANAGQYIRPVIDSYYKDKNAVYGFDIKTKEDDYTYSNNYQQPETRQQSQTSYNHGYLGSPQSLSYIGEQSNHYQDSQQSSNVRPQSLHRNQIQPQTDVSKILQFGDIPYKLTQGFSNDDLKLHNIKFDQSTIPTPLPMRINQNIASHQLDVTSHLLNRLFFNKQQNINLNAPEIGSQAGDGLSTINGFKIANPFNVDLKLVAEILKGKPTDINMIALKEKYTNPMPLKLDLAQLQLLLKNENNGNIPSVNDGLSAHNSPYIDMYNNGRHPYQGIKYSRSQEEEESIIPIADASNIHPIGAVMEQDGSASEREVSTATDFNVQDDDEISENFEDNRPINHFLHASRVVLNRQRHPNILTSGRHFYQRKHPKSDTDEPYPLLKPPPPQNSQRSGHFKMENKYNRRRRIQKPKLLRVVKGEPLFEAGAEPEISETSVSRLLRPPLPLVEDKSDIVDLE